MTTEFPAAIFLRTRFILGTLADVRNSPVKQPTSNRAVHQELSHPSNPYPNVCLRLQTSCTTLPAPGRWLALFALLLYVHTHTEVALRKLQKPLTQLAVTPRPTGAQADKVQETPLKRSVIQQRRGLAIHEYRSAALLESVRMHSPLPTSHNFAGHGYLTRSFSMALASPRAVSLPAAPRLRRLPRILVCASKE